MFESGRLFGIPICTEESRDVVKKLINCALAHGHGYACVSNVYTLMCAYSDDTFKKIYLESLLTVPDGTPLVWAMNSLGYNLKKRIRGPDLMLAIVDQGRALGVKHYLFGGRPGSCVKMIDHLTKLFPGVEFSGFEEPPFRFQTVEEERASIEKIKNSGAHIVWVGIGSPKQEKWMAKNHEEIPCILVGVGAAFDFFSGRVRQAPVWVRNHGLEWLYRFAREPKRLFRKYLWGNSKFLLVWGVALFRYKCSRLWD